MTIGDLRLRTVDGDMPLADQVLLIVNTASRCGFTPQYEGLEALHRRYADRGFSVLAFPCNQFGAQVPPVAVPAKRGGARRVPLVGSSPLA